MQSTLLRGVSTVVFLLAFGALPVRAKSHRPTLTRCPDRHYLIQNAPALAGDPVPEPIVIAGGKVSFGAACPATRATLKSTPHRENVTATWSSCPGAHLRGKPKFVGSIDAACEVLTGTFRAPRSKVKVHVTAKHSFCGDGVVDPGNDEQCDRGVGCPGSQTCDDASCTCNAPVAPPTTTTTTTASTTTHPSTTTTSSTTSSTTTTTLETLTVNRVGTGTGTVTSTGPGIDCGASCSAHYPAGTMVTLHARTANGANSFFEGWSGDCTGTFHDCTVTMAAARDVTALFSSQTNNLVFVSSAVFPTNLGSAAAYDQQCNVLATAAGLNNATNDAFVAWTSDGTSTAKDRLGMQARGFVRLDGAPFADDLASLLTSYKLFNPIRIEETGQDALDDPSADYQVMTGTTFGGTAASGYTCNDWTSTSGAQLIEEGSFMDGPPAAWMSGYGAHCGLERHIYCFMKTRSTPLAPAAHAGRRIFLTNTPYTPGSTTPDAKCAADAPAGAASVKALIAYPDRPASAVIEPGAVYVRVDGQVVGTGADLLAGGILESGIWQSGNGTYAPAGFEVWTGNTDLTTVGTAAGTCNGWSDTSQPAGIVGGYSTTFGFWWLLRTDVCTVGNLLYCVETASPPSTTTTMSTTSSSTTSSSTTTTTSSSITTSSTTTTLATLTVDKVGMGTGTITSTGPGIDCGAGCSAHFPAGTMVTLHARTVNGANSFFQGWSGDCTGTFHDCTVTMAAARNVGAQFSVQAHNLVFVSSTSFATNLGSAAAYDQQCNLLASAAGINDAGGDAFVAWMSDANSAAATRLAGARGFVRMDGAPFADSLESLLGANQVFNSIRFDENGQKVADDPMTGTESDGTAGNETCNNWTSTAAAYQVSFGSSFSGPYLWTGIGGSLCSFFPQNRIFCFMKTRTTALTPSLFPGMRIFLTDTPYTPGSTTPDAKCAADAPAGAGPVRALIAYPDRPASAVIDPGAVYVRVDGQVVGTGTELLAAGTLESGIWQAGDGSYPRGQFSEAWTGHADLTSVGTAAGTCNGWTDTSQMAGVVGIFSVENGGWWSDRNESCAAGAQLYCVETGPPFGGKVVFLSSVTFTGNLGGLSGADVECSSLANHAGLPGSYKAWLSDGSASPSTRFTQASVPYVLVDDTPIAQDWADLTDGVLAAPIALTEAGAAVGFEFVWTGTKTDGTADVGGTQCQGWTDATSTWSAAVGLDLKSDANWTGNRAVTCDAASSKLRLYCFQQ